MKGTYLSQATDTMCREGEVQFDDYRRLLKVHILLYDHVRIPATQLLSNPYLFRITEDENLATVLQSRANNPSIIQPIGFGAASFREIAEIMLEKNTIHSLRSDDLLLEHSKKLDSFGSRIATQNEQKFRSVYRNTIRALILLSRYSNINDSLKSSMLKLRPWLRDQEFMIHTEWLKRIDQLQISDADRKSLALLSDSAYAFAFADCDGHTFSKSRKQELFGELFQQVEVVLVGRDRIDTTNAETIKSLITDFSFAALDILPLKKIVALRKEDAFTDLRKNIHTFASPNTSAPDEMYFEIYDSLNRCHTVLQEEHNYIERFIADERLIRSMHAATSTQTLQSKLELIKVGGISALQLLSCTVPSVFAALITSMQGLWNWRQTETTLNRLRNTYRKAVAEVVLDEEGQ